jgi:stage II sporulation protein D
VNHRLTVSRLTVSRLTVSRLLPVAVAMAVPAALALAPAAAATPGPVAHGPMRARGAAGTAPRSVLPAPALSGLSAEAEVGSEAGAGPGKAGSGAGSGSAPAGAATLKVTGHGSGNGVGLGQWGAFGYASEAGYHWTYRQILALYYGGTTLEPLSSTVADSPVSINLSELDGASVTTVRPHRRGAELTVNGGPATAGTMTVRHSGALQIIRATAGDVSVDLPGVGWRSYQGDIQIQPSGAPGDEGGQTWNVVRLEDYVGGVVPSESPSYWGEEGGEAALEAQAVAARSYALAYIAGAGRICDTTECQDYLGDPSTQGLGDEATYPSGATSATRSQVMCTVATSPCPTEDIALTQFGASSGGWTAGGGFPVTADAGDAVAGNPNHDWSLSVPVATLEGLYPQVGHLTSALVIHRSGPAASSWGGRAVTVQLKGTGGTVTDTGGDVAALLGLRSTWFRFATQP